MQTPGPTLPSDQLAWCETLPSLSRCLTASAVSPTSTVPGNLPLSHLGNESFTPSLGWGLEINGQVFNIYVWLSATGHFDRRQKVAWSAGGAYLRKHGRPSGWVEHRLHFLKNREHSPERSGFLWNAQLPWVLSELRLLVDWLKCFLSHKPQGGQHLLF